MGDNEELGTNTEVVFKKKKSKKDKKKFRRAQQTEDVGVDDDSTAATLENVRDNLKLRSREKGVNSEVLLKQKEETEEEKQIVEQYGLIDPKQQEEDEFGNVIQTSFAEETGRQERDRAMLKFVNKKLQEEEGFGSSAKSLSEYEKLQQKLWEVPDHLKTREIKDEITKGMLSNELLRGVPEVKSGLLNKVTAAHEAKYKRSASSKKAVPKSHLFDSIVAGLKQEQNKEDYSSARFERGTAINALRANDYNPDVLMNTASGKRGYRGNGGNMAKKAGRM